MQVRTTFLNITPIEVGLNALFKGFPRILKAIGPLWDVTCLDCAFIGTGLKFNRKSNTAANTYYAPMPRVNISPKLNA